MYIAWYYMILYVGRVITPSKATEITHGDSDIKNFPTKATIQLVQLTGMQATHVVWCVLFNWRRSTGLRLLWRSWCRPETPEINRLSQLMSNYIKIYQHIRMSSCLHKVCYQHRCGVWEIAMCWPCKLVYSICKHAQASLGSAKKLRDIFQSSTITAITLENRIGKFGTNGHLTELTGLSQIRSVMQFKQTKSEYRVFMS